MTNDLRKALEALEAACERVAAGRSSAVYVAMLDAGENTDLLTELDLARANARAALSQPAPAGREAGNDVAERLFGSAVTPHEPGAGWQPIETAPMNGLRILLFQKGRGAFEGYWHDDFPQAESYWMDDQDSDPAPTLSRAERSGGAE